MLAVLTIEGKLKDNVLSAFIDVNFRGGSGLAVLGPSGRPSNSGHGSIFDNLVQRASDPSHLQGDGPSNPGNGRKITMYRNGFIVDDGPFRDLNSPSSREFIACLERGDVPAEMRQASGGGIVDVHLDDKRGEDYVPPPPPAYIAFSGQGVSLRSETSSSSSAGFTATMLASVDVTVNDAAPTTVLQIRTHDGKKLRLKYDPFFAFLSTLISFFVLGSINLVLCFS